MTGVLGGIARWLAGLIIAMLATPLVAAAVAAGLDPETATGFIANLTSTIEIAIFIGLTLGTAKGLTFIKGIDPGAYANRVWKKEIGRQIADIPASQAKEVIKAQQANVTVAKYII